MRTRVTALAASLLLGSGLGAQTRKDPGTAMLWSVFITRAGHMYAGETGRGAALLLGGMGAGTAAFLLADREKDEVRRFPFPPGSPVPFYDDTVTVADRTPMYVAAGVGAAVWVYSLFDVPNAVRRQNRRHGLASALELSPYVATGTRRTLRVGFAWRPKA